VADEERRHRYYGLLRRESERLQRLVEGLLDFKRMESHAAEYRFETLDPGSLVRHVAEEFTLGADARASRLSVLVAPGLPAVRCDREAFTRALWNLLDNAAKYAPEESPIAIEVANSDGQVVVQVRDEGPGIPADEQAQIFRKFVRGSAARSSGAKGTGLGLAMVSHIMKAHRGQITVASRPGAGSTFSLVLPVEGAAS
jgi:signal transduction histidine kinase